MASSMGQADPAECQAEPRLFLNQRIPLQEVGHVDYDSDSSEAAASDTSDLLALLAHCEEEECFPTENKDTPGKTAGSKKAHLDQLKRIGIQEFLEVQVVQKRQSIRTLLEECDVHLPAALDSFSDEELLPILHVYLTREFNKRERLAHVTTLDDVIALLKTCTRIIVIAGAGISTSLGIPDFRSEGGIYSRLAKYQLADPQELFDISLFRQDPSIFFDFAKELLPSNRGYSPTHAFIRLLQDHGKLLRLYTQNIDDIESTAGIEADKLVQCHGSFRTATCSSCRTQIPGHLIFPDIKAGIIPKCVSCTASRKRKGRSWEEELEEEEDETGEACFAVLKPDITFFGEQLATRFRTQIQQDRTEADLLICFGTSLKVAPVAEVPNLIERQVPQVFVSKEKPGLEFAFDVELLGSCDTVVNSLIEGAGWQEDFKKIVGRGKIKA